MPRIIHTTSLSWYLGATSLSWYQGACRLVYYLRCEGRGLQNRQEEHQMGGWLGRSKIECLAGMQEVGNRLLLNEFVDKVFSNQTGSVFSLNITGQ